MIDFLAGAVTMGFAIAAACFARFWRKTRDHLFLLFALAFGLFAGNQLLTTMVAADDERVGYAYLLRVIGYVLILVGILAKNMERGRARG
jgi:hypothetical protein